MPGDRPTAALEVSAKVNALLLDIEGTTTPLDFVTRVLFPYAREHVVSYLARSFEDGGTRDDVRGLRVEAARDAALGRKPPPWAEAPEAVGRYACWLMDEDRKVTALKALQGRIWEEGFRAGHLQGVVYEDVPRAFERWHAAGRTIAIFSSGSILAQKLLFAHSSAGDLSHFLAAHFDTTTGPKGEVESYRRIAAVLGHDAHSILFVSDVAVELDAARDAGLATALCVRDGPLPSAGAHRAIRTFDDLFDQAPSPTNL
jgi:enolase-phosphatase E1